MKKFLVILLTGLSPLLAAVLALLIKKQILDYFEVELDAPDRFMFAIELMALPLAYVFIFIIIRHLMNIKISLAVCVTVSILFFLILSTATYITIYFEHFYTLGKAIQK